MINLLDLEFSCFTHKPISLDTIQNTFYTRSLLTAGKSEQNRDFIRHLDQKFFESFELHATK